MQKHRAICRCGTQLMIMMEPTRLLKIYCERCNRLIFPIETDIITPGQTEAKQLAQVPSDPLMKKTNENNSNQEIKVIDNYHVIKTIAEGGMGNVFLARHRLTNETVVIKALDMGSDPNQDNILDYFIREAQILKDLDHPNIVKFKGCGNFRGCPYFVMEFIEGEDLKEILSRGPIKISWAISIVFYIASALEYGHQFKLIHRDIKPANIILPSHKRNMPKLIDFGLAKPLGEHFYTLTQRGTVMGTPFYMPPEQIHDAKDANHRSDIYSLGATFYHMLAGNPPYHEFYTQGGFAIMEAIVNNKITPLEKYRSNLPKEIYQIISKAMSPKQKDRYSSATELKKVLKNFIESVRK